MSSTDERRTSYVKAWSIAGALSLFGLPAIGLAAPGDFGEPEAQLLWTRGGEAGSRYGWAIADMADVDGDGARELIVGAPRTIGAEGQAGRLEVLSGRTGELLWAVDGQGSDQLGYAMADAGDVDGDGITDVIAGAPGHDDGRGRVEVRRGSDGMLLLSLEGPEPGAFFGAAVASGGRLDAEPGADLVVGAERALAEEGGADAGAVFAYSGLDGEPLWTARGEAGERRGSGTSFVGDVDGDGLDDPFVGARDAGNDQAGAAWILDGATGALRLDLRPGTGGGDFGWFFVAGIGDVDGDEVPDLYVGDFAASAQGAGSGRAHLFAGATGAPLLSLPGAGPGEGLGPGRGAGDVDGDGVPDLVVGAYNSSAGASQAGRVFVVSSATGTLIRSITSLESGEQLGFDAVGLGDTNEDGAPELALAAARGDRVYLVAGIPIEGDTGGETDEGDPGETGSAGSEDTGGGGDPAGMGAAEGGCSCDATRANPTGWACIGLFGLVALFRARRSDTVG